MMKGFQKVSALTLVTLLTINAMAQEKSPLKVITKPEKGIEVIQKDSLFSLRFQFRMQNRVGYMSKSLEDLTPESFEFRVRRLRLGMRGFVYNPKFTYYIQLSFSRGDMDWEATNSSTTNTSPNIVRDAIALIALIFKAKKKYSFENTFFILELFLISILL